MRRCLGYTRVHLPSSSHNISLLQESVKDRFRPRNYPTQQRLITSDGIHIIFLANVNFQTIFLHSRLDFEEHFHQPKYIYIYIYIWILLRFRTSRKSTPRMLHLLSFPRVLQSQEHKFIRLERSFHHPRFYTLYRKSWRPKAQIIRKIIPPRTRAQPSTSTHNNRTWRINWQDKHVHMKINKTRQSVSRVIFM